MIASLRGLAGLAAIAIVLALAVGAGHSSAVVVDHSLVRDLDPTTVTELSWSRTGHPDVRIARDPASGDWKFTTPIPGIADPAVVATVLDAVRAGRWHRRGNTTVLGTPRVTLRVAAGSRIVNLTIGDALAGGEQVWIATGEHDARLVDGWIARTLDVDPLALRIRAPLEDMGTASSIDIVDGLAGDRLVIEGQPRRLTQPRSLALAPEASVELEQALAAVAIVRLPDQLPTTAAALAIAIAGTTRAGTIHIGGPCPGAPDLAAITTPAGAGCITALALDRVRAAIAHLREPSAAIVDRRPLPIAPAKLVLADAGVLDIAASRIDDHAVDVEHVRTLLAALAAPGEVVTLPPIPPIRSIVATAGTKQTITLDLYTGGVLARRGEPIALRPSPAAWAVLTQPSASLRDDALWLEDPTSISAVTVDGVRYVRGAVLGEWSREGVGAPLGGPGLPNAEAARVHALATVLAAVRAPPIELTRSWTARHRVEVEITTPIGPPVTHHLEIADRGPAGCAAAVDHVAVMLPARICIAVTALAATH